MDLKPQEANKMIAEYMGYFLGKEVELAIPEYHNSLDRLVPVWEKMNRHVVVELCRHKVEKYHWCYFRDLDNKAIDEIDESSHGSTIQEAACLATAKAILELK